MEEDDDAMRAVMIEQEALVRDTLNASKRAHEEHSSSQETPAQLKVWPTSCMGPGYDACPDFLNMHAGETYEDDS